MNGKDLIGNEIAGFRIEAFLGAGGMGSVYRAVQVRLKRPVALKILPPEFARMDKGYVARFLAEASLAAMVNHPNVVQVYDAGESDNLYYIAMELVNGVGLDKLVDAKGHLEEAVAADLVDQAAQGLAAARKKNLVHRDVKPANLMVDEEGRVKVADFGLAKDVGKSVGLTRSGQILGTPLYMSPEQASGEPADHRSDIYSLGITFYHLLTGEPPFLGENVINLVVKQTREPLPDPRAKRPDLCDETVRVLRRMTEKPPAERYQEPEELARDLKGLQKTISEAAKNAPGASGLTDVPTIFLSHYAGEVSKILSSRVQSGRDNLDGVSRTPDTLSISYATRRGRKWKVAAFASALVVLLGGGLATLLALGSGSLFPPRGGDGPSAPAPGSEGGGSPASAPADGKLEGDKKGEGGKKATPEAEPRVPAETLALEILSPESGTLVRATTVEVAGRIVSGVPSEIVVGGVQAEVSGKDFSARVPLDEGSNEIPVLGIGSDGKRFEASIRVLSDVTMPLLEFSESPPALTNRSPVLIRGILKDAHPGRVTIAGAEAPLGEDGSFEASAALSEGVNTVEVLGFDRAGNSAGRKYTVVLDSVPPAIVVSEWRKYLAARANEIRLQGRTSKPCVAFFVNTVPVALDGGTSFSSTLRLREGRNTFPLEAEDRAGNAGKETVEVVFHKLDEGIEAGGEEGVFVSVSDGAEMVFVPGGTYRVPLEGADPAETKVEGYYIDRFEVTVERYANFLAAAGSDPSAFAHPGAPPEQSYAPAGWDRQLKGPGTMPVSGVDWYSAWAYARWAEKMLPREAQWMVAAGFDSEKESWRLFPWGDEARKDGGNIGSVESGPKPAGSYPEGRSPFGVLDMAGNLREWCLDSLGDPDTAVLKGGAWNDPAESCSVPSRVGFKKTGRYAPFGFRCVRPRT